MNELARHPLISVIIPTYNRANLIDRAIVSAIEQSYKNLEILVIDDASTDRTEEIVYTINDSRIRYIRHQTNLGGAAARNTGIDAAKGEYIAFLDSDDIWSPNKIEMQINAIQNHPHTEQIVSYTQVENHNGKEIYIMPKRRKDETESVAEYLFLHGGEMLTSSLLMSRSLALATRFRPELKKHQDLDLCLRLERNGAKFDLVEKPLVIWNNQMQNERISKIGDYQLSASWIAEYRDLISSKATKGFLIKEVVPKLIKNNQKKIYAAKIIIDAAVDRVISFNKFIRLSYWLLVPTSMREKLSNIMPKNIRYKR